MNNIRIRCWALCLGAAALSIVTAHGQASIEGRVVLPKAEPFSPPPRRYVGQVGEIAAPDPVTAVVYLEGQFPPALTNAPAGTNTMWQEGMQFRPALLPVRVGTAVAFPNDDAFYHNVFSYSKVKRFDLGRYRKEDRPPVQVFDKAGVVKLFCEIHDHMRGVILVLNTPFFARTDPDGVFRLNNLPAGSYLLKAWINESLSYQLPVNLKAGETLHVDFESGSATGP